MATMDIRRARFSLPNALLNVPDGQSSGSSVPSGQYRPVGHSFASFPWLGVADFAPVKTSTTIKNKKLL